MKKLIFLYLFFTVFVAKIQSQSFLNQTRDDILEALKINLKSRPTILIKKTWSKTRRKIAYTDEQKNIVIEEDAHNLLLQAKDSTQYRAFLTMLIGHELAHIYYHNKHIENTSDTTEHDADILAGFAVFLTGCYEDNIFEKMIDKLSEDSFYKNMLENPHPNYPDAQNRKDYVKDIDKQLKDLVLTYRTASYLSIIGRYGEALELYQTVAIKFKSSETLNNIAVSAMQKVLKIIREDTLASKLEASTISLAYPFELEARHRLYDAFYKISHGKTTFSSKIAEQINPFISESEENLNESLKLEKNFNTYLNYALLHLLATKTNQGEAQKKLNQAQKLIQKDKLKQAKYDLVQALIYIKSDKKDVAKKLLQNIIQETENTYKNVAFYAQLNLDLLTTEKVAKETISPQKPKLLTSYHAYIRNTPIDASFYEVNAWKGEKRIYYKKTPYLEQVIFFNDQQEKVVFNFFEELQAKILNTRFEFLGSPTNITNTAKGSYWVFERCPLVLFLKDSKIKNYFFFAVFE